MRRPLHQHRQRHLLLQLFAIVAGDDDCSEDGYFDGEYVADDDSAAIRDEVSSSDEEYDGDNVAGDDAAATDVED